MSSYFQDFLSTLLGLEPIGVKFNAISGTLLVQLQESLSNTSCSSSSTSDTCRDDTAALPLKLVALLSILVTSAAGITIPLLLDRRKNILPTNSNLFTAAKAFAAGVILATGFVHMLPDASENLTDSCLPKYPWRKFPFSGFIAMISALVTLMVDSLGTQFYESRKKSGKVVRDVVVVDDEGVDGATSRGHVEGSGGGGGESRDGHVVEVCSDDIHQHNKLGHSHSHGFVGDVAARNVVVAQVLEVGIVSHSILIGLSLGVSHSPCIIKPLVAALSFHQFFEGFALGGCIAKAEFKQISTIIMACFFTFTTPFGIAIGIALASSYNPSSARALVFEGILDSVSAGILIYMALVDLIAADFMTNKMRSNSSLQVVCYFGLFFGALLMSALAIWA